ncbi:uncharacterized protein LOC117112492 [Anneissia japonica]|uniref:uncharacterized protein LOC117112492 n=1 Tax=Anneissia japonica TaxID=1529436 RepID=UPI00142596DD|nr:uncharacterized protein LOC117112492 [Anneissia japonica]
MVSPRPLYFYLGLVILFHYYLSVGSTGDTVACTEGYLYVIDPQTFFETAVKVTSKINVIHVSKEEIDLERERLDVRWEDVFTLPDTHKMHFIVPTNRHIVKYAPYSTCPPSKMKEFRMKREEEIAESSNKEDKRLPTCGDFVLVRYQSAKSNSYKHYVALVTDVDDFEANITHLFRQDKEWKVFVEKNVNDKYGIVDLSQIVEILKAPYMDNRG